MPMNCIYGSPIFESSSFEKNANGKFIIKGKFSECDVENGNGRVYSKPLMHTILESTDVKSRLANRQMLGELGHPVDTVETTFQRVSHIVTKLEERPDGIIYGEAEVLDTPNGQILKTLYEANVKLGISSRGYIPENSDYVFKDGHYYIPDDYELISFDIVLDPSCFGAYPVKEAIKSKLVKIVSESKELAPQTKDLVSKIVKQDIKPILESTKSSKITLGFESLTEAVYAKSILEAKFTQRINRQGKNLEVIANGDAFSLRILANKINAVLNISESKSDKFSKFSIAVDEQPCNISSLLKTKNTKSDSKVKEDQILPTNLDELNEKCAQQQQLIATLESKKVFSIKVIEALVAKQKQLQEDLNKATQVSESRAKQVNMYKNMQLAKAKNLDLSVAAMESLKGRTTCSEQVIDSLSNKCLSFRKQNIQTSRTFKALKNEFLDLKKQYESVSKQLDSLKKEKALYESTSSEVINHLKNKVVVSEGIINSLKDKLTSDAINESSKKNYSFKPKAAELPVNSTVPKLVRTKQGVGSVNESRAPKSKEEEILSRTLSQVF